MAHEEYAYIRIPKTGSSSVYQSIQHNRNVACFLHHPVSYYLNHGSYKYITFVRNPLEIYISYYYFAKKRFIFGPPIPMGNKSFNSKNYELFKAGCTLEEFLLESYSNQFLPYYMHPLIPEEFYFIGITEKFEKSIEILKKMSNIEIKNIKINVGQERKKYEDKLSSETKERFYKKNIDEFILYKKSLNIFNDWEKTYEML